MPGARRLGAAARHVDGDGGHVVVGFSLEGGSDEALGLLLVAGFHQRPKIAFGEVLEEAVAALRRGWCPASAGPMAPLSISCWTMLWVAAEERNSLDIMTLLAIGRAADPSR
jgi:hypothetical protein